MSEKATRSERDELIEKLGSGVIQRDEAQRLAAMLEKDKNSAEMMGDNGMAVAVGMILGALGYYLYKELDGEKK